MAEGYAHPELLAETDWLAEHMGEPHVRIVDCDEQPGYQRLHIQGAIGLRTHHYLKDPESPDHIMPPALFEKTMSAHGIGDDTLVVAYDNSGGLYAARLWWALDYYGHPGCKVLNGGFRSWYLEGRPVTQDQPHVDRAAFNSRPGSESCATLDEVKRAIDSPDTVIWDVRASGEYTGEDQRQNKHGGHIPGAVHLEWLELTEPPARSGKLLPADEIRRKLELAGITAEKQVLVH